MRILHVLTLVTPDGAYGGPLRVALNQIRQLRERGHDAVLVAGASGFVGPLPRTYEGVPCILFPSRQIPGVGFSGHLAPGLLRWLSAHAREADVVHVHFARELTVLGAAQVVALRRRPWVAHTHGMVAVSDSPLAPPLDLLATRRLLHAAGRVLALTQEEVRTLHAVDPTLAHVTVLPNGVPPSTERADPGREPVDVLFLARLAPRKRPVEFVRAAQLLAARYPHVTFSLCGPDEGEGEEVRRLLARDDAAGRIRVEGPLPPGATAARMARSGIYVLPAVHEPFGMTVVEAMSVGLPAVVVEDCGLADLVRQTEGVVVDESLGALVDGIDALLSDPERRVRTGAAGLVAAQAKTGLGPVTEQLLRIYAEVIAAR
jgi:glycosyltransferase involved in cell wall biosynthesis